MHQFDGGIMRNILVLTVFIFSGLSCNQSIQAESPVKKDNTGVIRVCRHFTGGPQCMDEKEMKNNSVNSLRPKNENAPAVIPAADVTLENAADKLRENGITVLETDKINNPVCSACYQCPKYDIDLCFKINPQDLEKAQKLGFAKKENK